METWQIVLIVVAVLVVLALLALLAGRRRKAGTHRKQEQAREHLQEAQVRGARAEREQALAEEQAARARRERAEVEERAALAEQEAHERSLHAQQEASRAQQLHAQAEKLAPGVAAQPTGPVPTERTEVIREPVQDRAQPDLRAGDPAYRDDPAHREGHGGDGATRR